jgi:GT2 family glycosyltransferase
MTNTTALIKTFLRDNYLYRCVSSLKRHYPGIQVIVADDGHTSDEKEAKLKQLGVGKYLRLPFNSGLPYGRNRLLDHLETPYFLIGDDDFLYTEATHLEHLLKLTDIADIAAGALSNGKRRLIYEGAVAFSDGGARFRQQNDEYQTYRGVRYKTCDVTFNFFIGKRRTMMARWNEDLHMLFEHADFFLEVYKLGHTVVFTPDVVALHHDDDLAIEASYKRYRSTWEDKDKFFRKWRFSYLDMFGNRHVPI